MKLKKHIDTVASAFRKETARLALPHSIKGLWKADLFLGFDDTDYWVGTSVKVNDRYLEPARGLRIGIVPAREGGSDYIVKDERRKIVVCPIPHDQGFMEVFYQGWGIVQQFIAADAGLPKEVQLPRPPERQVARYLFDRRDFPVVDVIEALIPLAQPELLDTEEQAAHVNARREATSITGSIIAPIPQTTSA